MKEKEAIAYLKAIKDVMYDSLTQQTARDALDMAIQALEKQSMVNEILHECTELKRELDAYKAIGTLDQCREVVERMKPKKVIVEKDECISKSVTGDEDYSIKYVCPACGSEKLMRGYPCNC